LPDDLTGKAVLDVGPAHGFFAFELEARNASRVVTVELPRWSAHDVSPSLREQFDRDRVDEKSEGYLHGALEFAIAARGSKADRVLCNVYDLDPDEIGTFDLVLCASVLMHLSDPLRALYAIRAVTKDVAIIATMIDSASTEGVPRACFYGTTATQTFWAPNMACLKQWALAAGFARVEPVSTFHLQSLDGKFNTPHGTIRAYTF
jgi:tRNA (mo5U34)-methyltransferase